PRRDGRPLPRRSAVSTQCDTNSPAAAARATGRHTGIGTAFLRVASHAHGPADAGVDGRRDRRVHAIRLAGERPRAGEHRRTAGHPACRPHGERDGRVRGAAAAASAARRRHADSPSRSNDARAFVERHVGRVRARAHLARIVDVERQRRRSGSSVENRSAEPLSQNAPPRHRRRRRVIAFAASPGFSDGVSMRSTWMNTRSAACGTALALCASMAAAQQTTPPTGTLPADVRREVVERWNGANALRANGRLELAAGRDVAGNLAIAGGPLVLAGHVQGRVTVVNAHVVLGPTARIDGDLLVVGGDVDGRNAALVGGPIRIYREPLVYHDEGDRIVDDQAADSTGASEGWLSRLEHRHEGNWTELLRVVQAGPYNRVEGLPIELGPVVNRLTPWGSFRVDAAAVVRTASTFRSADGDVGHRLRGEVRVGRDRGIGVGAQAINVVDAVESWQLSDLETALAAFLVRRDYRDYYERHGGSGYLTLYGASDVSLTGSYGEERWSSAPLHNPFTLFNSDRAWRPNPRVDEGLFHLATATFNLDTRTDPDDPWSGWYVNAELEHGTGTIALVAPTSEPRPLLTGRP